MSILAESIGIVESLTSSPKHFMKEHGVDPRQDAFGEQELLQKANQVKHALTQRESFIIGFNFEGNRLRTELSQAAYAKMSEDLVERTLLTTRIALDEAKHRFQAT